MRTLARHTLLVPALFFGVSGQAQESHLMQDRRPVVDILYPLTPTVSFANTRVTPNMGNNAGIATGIAVYPFEHRPIALELRARFGRYGRSVGKAQIDTEEDGLVDVDINHFSRMHQLLFGLKFIDQGSAAFIKPFFTPQIGWAFMRSRLNIPDPSDDCKALESRLLHAGNGSVYGGEAGLEFSLTNKIIRGSSGWMGRDCSIFVAATLLRSFREVEYINVRNMMEEVPDAVHTMHHGDHHSDIAAAFVNIRSNEVHHHKVAEIHKAPLSFVGVSVGVIARF